VSEVAIVSGARTAIAAFGGSLKDVPVVHLGALVIREALKRAGLRPKAGENLSDYAPKLLKDVGLTELEKANSDWDLANRSAC
jgi:acetyl-CoA C-acetyltransferase